MGETEMKKLFVVDLMNMAYRAYHGVGDQQKLMNSKGVHTYVCYGVALALQKLIEQHSPDYLVIATDSKGRSFRHEIYEGYKSNRGPAPTEFIHQLPYLYRMLEAYGFNTLAALATEADDIIGTVATRFGKDDVTVYIVSNDKDYMQLVNANVRLCKSTGREYETGGEEAVLKKFGCKPDQVVDCLALLGDAVDAVPGVRGIGEKTAERLIKSYGTLENIYDNLDKTTPAISMKLFNGRDSAFMSKKLVTIKTDIPLDLDDIEAFKVPSPGKALEDFYQELEFHSLLRNLKWKS